MQKIKGKNTKSSRNEFKTENPYLRLEEFEQKKMQQWRLEMGARSVWEGDSLERR